MRTPIRSEFEAFLLTVASAVAIGVSVLVGLLTQPLAGIAVFVVAILVALIAYLRAGNPDRRTPLRDAAHASHPRGAPDGQRHVLVIANATLSGTELQEQIAGRDGQPVEIDVLAPLLTSRLHHGMSDIDRERREAQARLDRSLAWASELGIVAHGEVGDPNPTTAIEDELRDFGADEVIVVSEPRDRELWQEHVELARLRAELDIPITHILVDDDGAAAPSGPPR